MKVYIPCYFNNIKERETNFYINLKQYLKLGYKVVICWMNEQDFNYKDNRIKVIKHKPVNTSTARNMLLRIFYKSKEPYAIFSDDDTYLKKRIEAVNDCTCFTNDYEKGLKETEQINSAILIISNFKTRYSIEIYFDENLEANQDLDFGITLNLAGIKTYRQSTNNVIINTGVSSMFTNDMNKLNKKQESLEYINNKHGRRN